MEEQLVQISVSPLVQKILAGALAFTMLSVAIGLKPGDFSFIRSHPRSLIVGSFAQLIALPLLTIVLIKLLEVNPALSLGMIIVACCPGGSMSNLITKLAGGDAAYSVALTMISSVFSAALLPLAILFWVSLHAPADALIDQVNIDRASFIIRTSLILLVPLATGVFIASKLPELASKLQKIFMPISVLLLMGIIISGLITNRAVLVEYGLAVMPLMMLHNALAFAVGAGFGFLILKEQAKARALTIEVGIQNAGLGLIIIVSELGGYGEAAVMVGAWGIWHLIGGFVVAGIFRLGQNRVSN